MRDMVNPESYKAGYADSLGKKLFILRDTEGVPNKNVTKFVRMLQRELGSQESFVGIAPVGSSVAGHSLPTPEKGISPSDIDVAIFFDSSIDQNAQDKLVRIYENEIKMRDKEGQIRSCASARIAPSRFEYKQHP